MGHGQPLGQVHGVPFSGSRTLFSTYPFCHLRSSCLQRLRRKTKENRVFSKERGESPSWFSGPQSHTPLTLPLCSSKQAMLRECGAIFSGRCEQPAGLRHRSLRWLPPQSCCLVGLQAPAVGGSSGWVGRLLFSTISRGPSPTPFPETLPALALEVPHRRKPLSPGLTGQLVALTVSSGIRSLIRQSTALGVQRGGDLPLP